MGRDERRRPRILTRRVRPPDRTEVTGPEQTDVYDVWGRAVTAGPAASPSRWSTEGSGVSSTTVHTSRRSPRPSPATASTSRAWSTHASGCRGAAGPAPAPPLARVESVHADTHLPDRVVVVGHSAGGHLALWLASGDRAPWLTGVLALAPAADLGEVARLGLSEGAAVALVGGTPDDLPDAWADADPGASA